MWAADMRGASCYLAHLCRTRAAEGIPLDVVGVCSEEVS